MTTGVGIARMATLLECAQQSVTDGILPETCGRWQVSVDVCIAGQGFADAATLRELAQHTGGELRHCVPFAPGLDADQLLNDLRWSARRPQVGPPG